MEDYISPSFKAEKLNKPSIDDLIDVFKDRTFNWLIEPAKILLKEKHGDFGAMCILLTYFEVIWAYITGEDSEGRSKKYFKSAFIDVFQSPHMKKELLKRVSDIIYEDARCGFFHDSIPRRRIKLAGLGDKEFLITVPRKQQRHPDIDGKIESIIIDPNNFLSAIERHFVVFLLFLRNPNEKEKREKFIKFAKEKWDYEGEGVIVGLNSDGRI